MLKLKHILIPKISKAVILILLAVNCSKDQNTFLPYVRVNLPIPLATNNHLMIPRNSILFQNYGVKGVIVVCVNPELNQYLAFDACCPYEKDYSGAVEIESVRTEPNKVLSSAFVGICNKCGSEFILASGQPIKGPATHYLQNYNVIASYQYLTVTN